jgi:N-acetylneuraminic acid mutarotase
MSPLVCRLGVVTLSVTALLQADDRWRREPDLATARSAHALVATAEAMFVLAGTGPDGRPVLDVERFDGRAWTRETSLPAPGLNAPAAAAVGSRIYVIGGFNAVSNVPTAEVRVYDTSTRQWSMAAPLPAPRGGHAVAVLDGRIHAIGGGNSVSTIADHSLYDPRADAWTDRAKLPRAMGSPAAAVLGGRLYSIGGRSGPSDFGDVHVYDPAKDAWTAGPSIDPRGTAGAVAFGGTIYLVGGESQARRAVLDEVLRLDPARGTWALVSRLPTARNFARAVVFRDRIFTVGGSRTAGSSHASVGSAVVESFRPGR